MDTVLPSLFLQVILIASNAFFAMSEFAVVSVNTQKMKRLAEGGSKPAARLLVITEAPSDFLATIQVGVTLSGFLASAAAADSFADPLVSALSFIPIPASTLRGVTVFLITIILSYFMLIFGELAPKRIVYISCNPQTQARDAAFLVERGWRIVEMQPVDMFPHTSHAENIILLERR